MGIHTPIDNRFKFGELYGIRKSYSDMNRTILESETEKTLFNNMMNYMVESGNIEKIERFAKKNKKLRDFVVENSLTDTINLMMENTKGLNIPKVVKKRAADKLRMAVSDKALSIKTNEYRLPSFNKFEEEPTIYESEDNNISLSDDESENIDKLINDIAIKNGILGNGEIIQSKNDKEFEKTSESDDNVDNIKKHNYSIRSIIIESIAGNEKKTVLIPPTLIYNYSDSDAKDYLNSTIKNVINGINATCGLNFPENDYLWIKSGRPVPFLKCEMVVNSDMVKGNRLLNAYFGPVGEFKDYLYRADGTPRIEMSKASSMSKIDKEVNAILSYPIIKVYSTIVSWDIVNGEEVIREIGRDDFHDTSIKFVE